MFLLIFTCYWCTAPDKGCQPELSLILVSLHFILLVGFFSNSSSFGTSSTLKTEIWKGTERSSAEISLTYMLLPSSWVNKDLLCLWNPLWPKQTLWHERKLWYKQVPDQPVRYEATSRSSWEESWAPQKVNRTNLDTKETKRFLNNWNNCDYPDANHYISEVHRISRSLFTWNQITLSRNER